MSCFWYTLGGPSNTTVEDTLSESVLSSLRCKENITDFNRRLQSQFLSDIPAFEARHSDAWTVFIRKVEYAENPLGLAFVSNVD